MSSTTGTPNDLSLCKRDEYYYFEDVYFIVEKTIFKVPRHHFDESAHFAKVFGTAPGSAGGDIIKVNLEDTMVEDFRQLLRVLYPRHFDAEELTTRQWISVLSLSTLWGFDKVRTIAIRKLEAIPMSGIKGGLQLLVLSQRHGVKEWLLRALRLLAEKNEFKEAFADAIGAAMSYRVTCLQGMVAGVRWEKKEKGSKQDVSEAEIDRLIKVVFPEVELPKDDAAANGTKGSEPKK